MYEWNISILKKSPKFKGFLRLEDFGKIPKKFFSVLSFRKIK